MCKDSAQHLNATSYYCCSSSSNLKRLVLTYMAVCSASLSFALHQPSQNFKQDEDHLLHHCCSVLSRQLCGGSNEPLLHTQHWIRPRGRRSTSEEAVESLLGVWYSGRSSAGAVQSRAFCKGTLKPILQHQADRHTRSSRKRPFQMADLPSPTQTTSNLFDMPDNTFVRTVIPLLMVTAQAATRPPSGSQLSS